METIVLDHPGGGLRAAASPPSSSSELERLAATLPALIARDDQPPPLWLTAVFADEVEGIRLTLSSVDRPDDLALGLDVAVWPRPLRGDSYDAVVRRLGRDPVGVAFAIRWIELAADARLPAWPDLVRRRALRTAPPEPALEAATWFG